MTFSSSASAIGVGKKVDSVLGSQGSGSGQIEGPNGVAIRESTGLVYVFDATNRRIVRFTGAGVFDRAWGWDVVASGPGDDTVAPINELEICVPANGDVCKIGVSGGGAGQIAASGLNLAVDQADGSVYVADASNSRIQKFDANGNFLRMWGKNVIKAAPTGGSTDLGNVAEVCAIAIDCQAGATGSLGGEFSISAGGIAVDPSGNVYVGEGNNRRIQKFTANGAFISAWGWDASTPNGTPAFEICTVAANCLAADAGSNVGQFGSGAPRAVVVDSASRVYAADVAASNNRVMRFASDGSGPEVFGADALAGAPQSLRRYLAVDRSNDHLFVMRPAGSPEEVRFFEFDSSGTLVNDQHGAGALIPPAVGNGIGYTPVGGKLYFTTSSVLTGHRLVVLDNDGGYQSGAITLAPPSEVGVHTVTFSGTANPNGADSKARFEYSANGADWTAAGPDIALGSGTSPVPITQAVAGLQANKLYRVRILVTAVFAGQVISPELTFATDASAPEATTTPAIQIGDDRAVLRGVVNPNSLPTTYHFEYGTTTAYGHSAPIPEGSAGAGGVEMLLSQFVDGLLPDVTYHYRVVATSAEGTSKGADATFRTRAVIAPPEGRAYEMVTPADKNNRNTSENRDLEGIPIPNPGVPSLDGDSLFYTGANTVLDPEAGSGYANVGDSVVIRRTATGWKGEAVSNALAAEGGGTGVPLASVSGLSGDLEAQTWRHAVQIFPTGSELGTKIFGDKGGLDGTGWYDWLGAELPAEPDAALIADGGAHMMRWGCYAQLLGASGPSGQNPDDPDSGSCESGQAIYSQSPAGSGPLDFVNECTGTVAGGDATEVPLRDANGTVSPPSGVGAAAALANDLLGGQSCEEGSVVSRRGAAIGGNGNQLDSARVTAMSGDGKRIFFLSPDPGTSIGSVAIGGNGRTGCGGLSGAAPPFTEHTGTATECPAQVYVRQYDSSGDPTVRWISKPEIAGQAIDLLGRGALFEGASSDGRIVYFRTNAPLTEDDRNGTGAPAPPGGITTGVASDDSWDLYRYELPASLDANPAGGSLTRISGGDQGEDDPNTSCPRGAAGEPCGGGVFSEEPGRGSVVRYISDDGERVYFVTVSEIGDAVNSSPEGGATAPGGTASTSSGARNLYLYDGAKSGAARWKFVARLPFSITNLDGCASFFTPQGASQGKFSGGFGKIQRNDVNCVRGTADGGLIAFETTGQLTDDDDDAASDVYVYDASADELTRISAPPADQAGYGCDHDGDDVTTECNADLGFSSQQDIGQVGLRGSSSNVSDDGAVFFETRLALIPVDVNGRHWDTYMWKDGELSLISPGNTSDHAFFSGNSEDGKDVFFYTSQRIDPREIDDADLDVYDARVGGGLPPPPSPPALCSVLDGSCSASAPAAPPATAPGSNTFRGAGNVVQQPKRGRKCAPRKVKRKGKCVSRKRGNAQHRRQGK